MAKILLVEDDDQLRARIKIALISAGYEVWEAPDGTGVCELYKKQRFDLVITDLVMPRVEGIELIMDLQRVDNNANIVAMSGEDSADSYLRVARNLGVQHTLSIPFAIPEFLRAVSLALESSAHNESRLDPD